MSGSGISVLAARHDDDIYIYIYIYKIFYTHAAEKKRVGSPKSLSDHDSRANIF